MRFILFNIIMIFLSVSDAFSAPTCGTVIPGKNKFQWGLAVNSIIKYKMKGAVNKIDLRSNQAFLTLAYGIFNNLVSDGKLGMGNIKKDLVNNARIDYDLGWGGGYGLRFKLYENDEHKTKIILGAHHISIHPSSEDLELVEYKSILDDNQFDTIFSKEYNFGIPYIGLKLSRRRFLRRDDSDNTSLHSPWKIGVVLGYDREITQDTYMNLEIRLINETSLSMGLSHRF